MNLAIVSGIISALALFVAAIHAIIDYYLMKHANQFQTRTGYYNKIFDDYLIKRIPDARKYIRFDENDKLADSKVLISALDDMMNDAVYFKYNNCDFYERLKKQVIEFADFISKYSNEKVVDEDDKAEINMRIRDGKKEL